jgi:putative flippase GtrA
MKSVNDKFKFFMSFLHEKALTIPAYRLYAQLMRYLVVGGTAAIVDWLGYWILINKLAFHYVIAALISFTVATAVNYFLSIKWVFTSNGKYTRLTEVSLVFLVSAIGLLINQLSLLLFVETFSLHYMSAKILATGLVFFWNFSLRKYYIFNS